MTRPHLMALLCHPSRDRGEDLSVQVYRDLLAAIGDGRLAHGARLPSSRAAAAALGLSRSTVNTAYDLLRAEGVIAVRPGAAPSVRAAAQPEPPPTTGTGPSASRRGATLAGTPRATEPAHTGAMAPGLPSEALFPADAWGRALRQAARRLHGSAAAYGEATGLTALRQVLSDRLAADRGIVAGPERILVTTGTQASLSLAAHVLADPGDLAAIEDPGYLGARAAFMAAGLAIAPLPVDAEGAVPDGIPTCARLLYLTPSNQYPTGARLSRDRRTRILAKAAAAGTVVLEDDYDSEFLWRGREIAALAAEDAGVIHMGTAAKVLMPALRLVPPDLAATFRSAQRTLGMVPNLHAQIALAETMRSGRYRAQLKRIARVYESRGRALAAALGALDWIAAAPPDGGVQITATFVDGRPEDAALAALAAAGFGPAGLSGYCLEDRRTGLVIGFADATPERTQRFAGILASL